MPNANQTFKQAVLMNPEDRLSTELKAAEFSGKVYDVYTLSPNEVVYVFNFPSERFRRKFREKMQVSESKPGKGSSPAGSIPSPV